MAGVRAVAPIPPVVIDLLASDGRVRRVASAPEASADLRSCQFRALVARLRSDPSSEAMATLLEVTPGSTFDLQVHLSCRHVRGLGGDLYLLNGRDLSRVVFVTLLDGPRTREVVSSVERPASPTRCAALAGISTVGPVDVMHDQLTGVSVVHCDQDHSAGLPLLESYGQALFSACAVAELLDDLG